MKTYAIGMMSGTSLDGVDVALVSIEGINLKTKVEVIAYDTLKLDEEIINKIHMAMDIKRSNIALITSLNVELGYMFAHAVNQFIHDHQLEQYQIDFISSHGQTIYHIPQHENGYVRSSLQLGEGSVISELCKKTVVSNFRLADIAAGGQGAPLVPFVDYILFSKKGVNRAIHNIGGIANTTILHKRVHESKVLAWDSGPGNMMIDRAMQVLFNQSYDKNGEVAQSGHLIKQLFDEVMAIDFFKLDPPKSTGRELFGNQLTDELIKKYENYDKKDMIHTLTHITAYSIAKTYDHHPIDELYICGGGAYNKFLVSLIQKYLPNVKVDVLDVLGIPSSIKEAVAFAVLGYHTLKHKPSNMMSATGAKKKKILGQINYYK